MGPGETIGRGFDTASRKMGNATRNAGWFTKSKASNVASHAAYGVDSALRNTSTGVANTTREIGRGLFGSWRGTNAAPSNLTPVSGVQSFRRLSRDDAYSAGYSRGRSHAYNRLNADPQGNARASTATFQRSYQRGYVRGWNDAVAEMNAAL
tara:strand:+ start:3668 stop:4123 length:456 start_codon:yes stop_codon:yes gene_type:complete